MRYAILAGGRKMSGRVIGERRCMSSYQIIFIVLLALSVLNVFIRSRRRKRLSWRGQYPTSNNQPARRVEDLMAAGASASVARELAAGNRINAIKTYMEETGAGLAEAKRAVDAITASADTARLMNTGAPVSANTANATSTTTPPVFASDNAGYASAQYPQYPQYPQYQQRPQPSGTLSERVATLLAQGQTIEAIKVYREEMGVGLREAKDAIDAIRLRDSVAAFLARGASERVATLLARGAKREAIKAYRQETGTDQHTAKSTIDLFLAR